MILDNDLVDGLYDCDCLIRNARHCGLSEEGLLRSVVGISQKTYSGIRFDLIKSPP